MEINPLIWTGDGRRDRPRRQGHDRRKLAVPAPRPARTAESVDDPDPQERMAQERGVTYVKLDGDVGILGNGAGLVMSTLDVGRPGGRPAGELPRRRRRLEGRRRRDRPRGAAVRRQGQVAAREHLRRHHPLRRGGRGPSDRARPPRRDPADRGPPRWHQRGGGARDHRASARPSNVVVEATMLSAARRAVELAKEAA